MKKLLSIVLVLAMVLGLSVTAFAEDAPVVKIAQTELISSGTYTSSEISAITSGSVTYTAPGENDLAKLTLNNATITCTDWHCIFTQSCNLEITLVGNNVVSSTYDENGDGILTDSLTIIGDGNLTVSSVGDVSSAILGTDAITLSMTGTLTATGAIGMNCQKGNLTVSEGAGKITARGNAGFGAIWAKNSAVLPEGYKAIGSTSFEETDESKMSDVTWDNDVQTFAMIGKAVAQTVVIYNPNAKPAEDGKSGTTDITATKEEPELEYTIVIPTNVAEITNFGVYEVGQAKVTGVTGATEKTVISYTAETTDFKCEGKTNIPATYHTEEAATNAFPTDAVKVYENKADVASLPTMWVKIAESDWDAAEAGTYTATVTFDFVKITPAALGETYTVTFDTNGHASFPPLPLTGVISGSTISAPIAPVDAGYTFDGWYKEAACTNAWNFDTDTVTADTTLYAKWTMWSPF